MGCSLTSAHFLLLSCPFLNSCICQELAKRHGLQRREVGRWIWHMSGRDRHIFLSAGQFFCFVEGVLLIPHSDREAQERDNARTESLLLCISFFCCFWPTDKIATVTLDTIIDLGFTLLQMCSQSDHPITKFRYQL